jgi:hypothetical protein
MAAEPKLGANRGNAGKGRPKGSQNKVTKAIREAVEQSFAEIGGAAYLVKMATEQPTAYMTLLGKVLPHQIQHSSPDGTMTPTKVIVQGVDGDGNG